jgi:serine/threonine kinase PknH
VPREGIGVSSPPPPDPWPAERATPENGFAEPERDDDDTGPVQISTPTPAKVTTSESGLGEDDWSRRFAEVLTINPRPLRRNRKPIVFFGVVALVAVVVVAALAFWLLRPSPATQDAGPGQARSAKPSPSKDADAQERLLRLLPPGYPSGSCKATATAEDALAQINCDKNSDQGGPLSATYRLVRDKAALDAALNDIVASSTRLNCPGNIQSPGPWRHNAAPDTVSGVLYCGVQDNRPTIAWTDEAKLVLSEVQSGDQGPTFDELYAWWSSHS